MTGLEEVAGMSGDLRQALCKDLSLADPFGQPLHIPDGSEGDAGMRVGMGVAGGQARVSLE